MLPLLNLLAIRSVPEAHVIVEPGGTLNVKSGSILTIGGLPYNETEIFPTIINGSSWWTGNHETSTLWEGYHPGQVFNGDVGDIWHTTRDAAWILGGFDNPVHLGSVHIDARNINGDFHARIPGWVAIYGSDGQFGSTWQLLLGETQLTWLDPESGAPVLPSHSAALQPAVAELSLPQPTSACFAYFRFYFNNSHDLPGFYRGNSTTGGIDRVRNHDKISVSDMRLYGGSEDC